MASVTKPLALTVNNTNVAASTYPAYSSGATYAKGANAKATNAADGLVYEYESLADDNTGNPLTDPTWWLNLGPCNRDAMFDSRTSTVTTGSGDIVVTVSPGEFFDTITLLNIQDSTGVSVSVDRGATNLYSDTQSLSEDVTSWYDFFFSPLGEQETKAVWNQEVFYSDATVTVTVSGTTPSVGLLLIGRAREIALTEYGASIGIEDYSTKETDQWGRTLLIEREYADTADVKMVLDTGQVDAIRRTLADLRATPALYNLNNEGSRFQSLVIFGKYDDFSIDIAYHTTAYCTLRLTGLL